MATTNEHQTIIMKNEISPADIFLIQNIHASWILDLPNGKLINKLCDNSTVIEIIKTTIFKGLKIKNTGTHQENGINEIVSGFSADEMELLVLRAGSVIMSKKIRQIIKTEEIKRIKTILGDELYKFSINHSLTPPSYLPINTSLQGESISKDGKILLEIINQGYHSLCLTLGDAAFNTLIKLPKPWNMDFLIYKNQTQYDRKEQLIHINLIRNIAETIHHSKLVKPDTIKSRKNS